METSDSENFESADEDFQSEDEDTNTVKSVTKIEKSVEEAYINSVETKLKDVKLTETQPKTSTTNLNNNKNDDIHEENLTKDNENNIKISQISDKSTVKKLGPKLNTNVDNTLTLKQTQESLTSEESVMNQPSVSDIDNVVKQSEVATVSSESNQTQFTKQDKSNDDDDNEENLWNETEMDWGNEKEENMWDNDDWEPVEELQTTSKPQQKQESQENVPPVNTSWASWGNWDVSTIISTATQGVSTFTQGISTVLETGIGVPEPEELARINQLEKENVKEANQNNDVDKNTGFGLGNLVLGVSHLTKLVESTGTKVISGGLDTLETIGKKTMEVLQEGDPGLKKKRAFLKIDQDKPVLSQLLREAKEKAEHENKVLEQKHFAKKAKNYETLFDDHQGLVHLEALEMLSKQCDIKLQTLLESYMGEALTDMQETMDQVKELCELPDEDDDEQANWTDIHEKLNAAVAEINIPISYKKLIDTWEETETWLNQLKLEICDERELHQQAIETLAQLTAIAVEQFHKAGELLLVKEHRSTADEADSLVQLTTTLTSLIGVVAAKFSDKLNAKSSNSRNKEEINGLITNVFFEAANSSSYIQDAFQLLIPVLQVGAV